MFAARTNSMAANLEILSEVNHGSAAVTTAALGLDQTFLGQALEASVPGTFAEHQDAQSRVQPPPAALMTRAAAERFGNRGTEYANKS